MFFLIKDFFTAERAENPEKILKNWNDGILEYWRKLFFLYPSIIPLFHYSILFCLFNLRVLCDLCGSFI